MAKRYWLIKSEPITYGIDHLKKDGKTLWEGVRNFQARNFMMKDMQIGDEVLFYHSNAEPPGIAGIATISDSAQPDPTQFNKKSDYYDKRATSEKPMWFCAELKFKNKFKKFIPLDQLKSDPKLKDMLVLKRGQRLSIQPVTPAEFSHICHQGEL